ncbi:MAG: flavin monoamine oxidase family protein [Leptolyngbyaceae cyanobacterium SM1_1_3]|nr:flavin monoamine oxidase family protein [Leptolyngbyaceae cyanobacterium SM1_1_3]NJN02944.1 flavin monoamine oxidase family protein [Leptolyngbyaceae cyanobacterium RM1_1_2]
MKRRDFLASVSAAAGSVYASAKVLGALDSRARANDGPGDEDDTPRGPLEDLEDGDGKSVVILGAGLAGMTVAYELMKIGGYSITILEAQSRVGGRCWTLRDGDTYEEVNVYNPSLSQGATIRQTAKLSASGQKDYFNPGPARIPQHHITIDYCKELGVKLEVFANANLQQYYYNENRSGGLNGTRVRARQVRNDIRGYIAEALAKDSSPPAGVDQASWDSFVRTYGALNADFQYAGSSRRGYDAKPEVAGVGGAGEILPPYSYADLINYDFDGYEAFEYGYDQQMLMFEPVGGMDMIAKALASKVGNRISLNAVVQEIRKGPNGQGTRVVYRKNGSTQQIAADICICTIPLTVLRNIPSDFSSSMLAAIAGVNYAETGKCALMYKTRFWEDEDILGGITSTDVGADEGLNINTIWYPSHDFLSRSGALVGYYNFGSSSNNYGALPPAERIRTALNKGEVVHPGKYKRFYQPNSGATINWNQVPYSLGGWASYSAQTREQFFEQLNQPDGDIWLCGEHLSYLTGWQAGAFESARLVLAKAFGARFAR